MMYKYEHSTVFVSLNIQIDTWTSVDSNAAIQTQGLNQSNAYLGTEVSLFILPRRAARLTETLSMSQYGFGVSLPS